MLPGKDARLRGCIGVPEVDKNGKKKLLTRPTVVRDELETRGRWCIIVAKGKIQVGNSRTRCTVRGLRASGRSGARRTKSGAADSHLTGGISPFSLFSSSRGVRVSLFRPWHRLGAGLADSVSGLTSGETFGTGN